MLIHHLEIIVLIQDQTLEKMAKKTVPRHGIKGIIACAPRREAARASKLLRLALNSGSYQHQHRDRLRAWMCRRGVPRALGRLDLLRWIERLLSRRPHLHCHREIFRAKGDTLMRFLRLCRRINVQDHLRLMTPTSQLCLHQLLLHLNVHALGFNMVYKNQKFILMELYVGAWLVHPLQRSRRR